MVFGRSVARVRATAAIAALIVACAAGVGHAQLRGVRATLTPLVGSVGVYAATEVRAALQVQLPDGFHVQSDRPRDPALIPTILTVDPPAGVSVVEIVYPPSTDLRQEGVEQPLAVFDREFAIGLRLAVGPDVPPGEITVPARLRYQACNDTTCFAPTTAETGWTVRVVKADTAVTAQHADVIDRLTFGHGAPPTPGTNPAQGAASASTPAAGDDGLAQLDNFVMLASAGGYVGAEDFLAFLHNAEAGITPRGLFDGRGPLAILLIVFLGGLALNLTPCVLPMIPINLAIIGAGAQAGSRRRGFLLGSTYGVAMAVVYGVLGLVVILTASTFGTINASPWFNAAIAVLFVVLGLAMFDVIAIDFSRLSSRFQPDAESRGSFALAFTMGGVPALLAGACVAPVVIQVVLFSSDLYATGTRSALALPFVLGIGMAVPWPIAGAGLSALPKPGLWMVRVKQAFGVLILGTALYYGYLAYELVANRWVDASSVASSVEEKVKAGWHASLADGLAVATRDQKPVLVDLWATWCKNCLTMDKTTFADSAVIAALGDYVKIKFKAEDPEAEPTKSIMARFNAIGLPTYVILRPRALGLTALAQPAPIVADVRAAIANSDFARADTVLAAYRKAQGVTPEMLEALSWMGRGMLAAKQLDNAERYATETYTLSAELLKSRKLDEEPRLPIAIGAAIEVLAQVDAQRGARTDAVLFLGRELSTFKGTSIEKRIQKNINLLSLVGTRAPALDTADHLGPTPPAVASLKGKVVLLFFWAHWCPDCKGEAPILKRLADTYGAKGLVILAPTQRFGYVAGGKPASREDETRYIDQVRQAHYPVLAGQSVPLSTLNHIRYGVSTTPTNVLVDRDGIIRLYHPGAMTLEQLEPLVRSLVDPS